MKTSTRPRVVMDTNVIFSALYDLNSDAGKLLIYSIEGRVELLASSYIMGELERNLKGKLGYSDEEFNETIKALPIEWIEDESYSRHIKKAGRMIKHERDIPILAFALSLKSDVVSGDEHFQNVRAKSLKCWRLKELIELLEEE
ncbi:MAG: PIN domain-containing protein [Candidatus Hydrothermarchaeales archaeon]